MALINQKKIVLDTSSIERELSRIANLLEQVLVAQGVLTDETPIDLENIDPDDYSSVLYTDENEELIQQHLAKRVGGVVVS
jgi:hypothetical protein